MIFIEILIKIYHPIFRLGLTPNFYTQETYHNKTNKNIEGIEFRNDKTLLSSGEVKIDEPFMLGLLLWMSEKIKVAFNALT